jgi:hypothetical protein
MNLFYLRECNFDDKNNEEIWKILNLKPYLFSIFQQYFLCGKDIKRDKFPFLASYCFVVDDTILVASVEQGILR